MQIDHSFKAIFTSMMIVSGLTACSKPGPAETAGKKIDEVTKDASNAVSSAADKADTAITKQVTATGQAMSDTEITAKVKIALLNEPGLKSLKIGVDTVKGVVTLTGTTNSQANIDTALKIAQSVEGVESVRNRLAAP
jgi:osmotically-inducible protein OsmY